MAEIIRNVTTVGGVLNAVQDRLLDGLFREVNAPSTQREQLVRTAQRRAITVAFQDLYEVWCPDANTRLRDVPVPTEVPHTHEDDHGNGYTVNDFLNALVDGGGTNIE